VFKSENIFKKVKMTFLNIFFDINYFKSKEIEPNFITFNSVHDVKSFKKI
jgi:hypothetical protein